MIKILIKKLQKTPTNCYLVSLAASDTLFFFASMPHEMMYLLGPNDHYLFGSLGNYFWFFCRKFLKLAVSITYLRYFLMIWVRLVLASFIFDFLLIYLLVRLLSEKRLITVVSGLVSKNRDVFHFGFTKIIFRLCTSNLSSISCNEHFKSVYFSVHNWTVLWYL